MPNWFALSPESRERIEAKFLEDARSVASRTGGAKFEAKDVAEFVNCLSTGERPIGLNETQERILGDLVESVRRKTHLTFKPPADRPPAAPPPPPSPAHDDAPSDASAGAPPPVEAEVPEATPDWAMTPAPPAPSLASSMGATAEREEVPDKGMRPPVDPLFLPPSPPAGYTEGDGAKRGPKPQGDDPATDEQKSADMMAEPAAGERPALAHPILEWGGVVREATRLYETPTPNGHHDPYAIDMVGGGEVTPTAPAHVHREPNGHPHPAPHVHDQPLIDRIAADEVALILRMAMRYDSEKFAKMRAVLDAAETAVRYRDATG